MEANEFIASIKADTVDKSKCDLLKVHEEFKIVLNKLQAKDRGLFGLNILRTLCWNLDKAPMWRNNIDNASMFTLVIDSYRETRYMGKEDRVKTLACIYHIHKYAVRLNTLITPESVLKISIIPFEFDAKYLLKDYHKTYWHILADRLTYLEKLKTKVNITKLLPKLTEDVLKILQIYDTIQFCSTIIVFVFKKLHMLYSDIDAKQLLSPFKQIFSELCQKDDVTDLKSLAEKEMLDIYTKLNDCLYVVADNSSRIHFKDGILDEITQKCASLVAHRMDLFHCLQTFYINTFCKIISSQTEVSYVEGLFKLLEIEFQNVNKPDYEKALLATYPYLNQLLRLYIEHKVTNGKSFTKKIQESCLKLILFFTKKLKYCSQILKCDDCPRKTGLHDAFRLSLLIKHLAQSDQNKTVLDIFYTITTEQYVILAELKKLGCANYQKFFRKLQTDVHNMAISLNKFKHYDASIRLFDIYLKYELKCTEMDYKNISRALFNKSICEMDSELYEKALINAFLSLTFAWQDGLKTDKHMNLVMDIKARELKSKSNNNGQNNGDEIETDEQQLVSILDACNMAINSKLYGDLTPLLKELKFSELLLHEFSMYAKTWPSVAPVAGVWRALHALARGDTCSWLTAENEAALTEVLYDVILETPSVVRTIHNPHFATIVKELVDDLNNITKLTSSETLVHASLLFLQCDYELAAASLQYGWKAEPNPNPDKIRAQRSVRQEHAATRAAPRALRALRLLGDELPALAQQCGARARSAVRVCQAYVPLLQHMCRSAAALQLAHYCCRLAHALRDRESFLRNAGVLLTSSRPSPPLDALLAQAARWPREGWGEADLVFLCDVAMYLCGRGSRGAAASLLRAVRTKILHLAHTQPDINLDLAVGRVLETQRALYGGSAEGPGLLTAVNSPLRHYLALAVTGGAWSSRRVRALHVRVRTSLCSASACGAARALGLSARARAAAAGTLHAEPALAAAALHLLTLDIHDTAATEIKIDQHLNMFLGLEPSDESRPSDSTTEKQVLFTPRQKLETMRDNMIVRRNHSSPSVVEAVPTFTVPEFLYHGAACACAACDVPPCASLACRACAARAGAHAAAGERHAADVHYRGVLHMTELAHNKLNNIKKVYAETYDEFIVESVMNIYETDFKSMQIKQLVDLAFYELEKGEVDSADERIVEINEIVHEMGDVDPHLKNDVFNLMVASARLKRASKKNKLYSEENENLLPSPVKEDTAVEPPTTPESKPARPPKPAPKVVVKYEELPQNRIVKDLKNLRLNDDEDEDFEKSKPLPRGPKKERFKLPNPILPKPSLEQATPRQTRSLPKILLSEPSVDVTTPMSKSNKENEFFTPLAQTPETFFTPISSVKTYSKKSLHQNFVKNLEREFFTPGNSVSKENRKESSTTKPTSTLGRQRSSTKEEITGSEEKSARKQEMSKKEEKLTVKEKPTTREVKSVLRENVAIKEKQIVKEKTCRKVSAKDEQNVAETSRTNREKRTLIRAVSPGKIEKEREMTTRSRR